MAHLGDYIREECHPVGAESDKFSLVGVSNEHGLVSSPRETAADNLSRYQRVERDWFAYNPMRVNVGSIGLADDDSKTGITSPDYVVFSCREGLDPRFLLHFLKSDYGLEAIARNCSGAVRKRLYYSGLAEIELIIPDIERQQALITRIERIQQAIRFIREENSDRHELPMLKQAILQEAIAGKLTADWRAAQPDVEPASQLLHRIQAEKARLIAAKKIRPEKPLPKITPAEIPFEIPQSWEWCRLGNILNFSSGDGLTAAQMAGGDVPVFGGNGINGYHDKANIETETVVVGRVGANCGAVHKTPARAWVTDNAFITTFSEDCLTMDFLVLLLRFLDLNHLSYDGSQPVISGKRVYPLPTPLPPLAEQAEIVERVEALMEHCRALAAEIAYTRTHAAYLLQAVLKEAFAPASTND